jgi:hypothetical protein
MATPAEVVASSFAQAQTYANIAQSSLTGFTDALNAAVYVPPTLSVTWNSIATPSLPSLPSSPSLPSISYVAPTAPSDFVDVAPGVTTIDDFTGISPNPSQLLTDLTNTIISRIAGGTGLDPAVEQAIWDRARSRELKLALANEDDIARTSEAMGFMMPAGVMIDQLRVAQQNYYDKASELSRDIAVKQAELEQTNLNAAIAAGTDLEGKIIQIYKTEADVYGVQVNAKAEIAKLGMARYESLIRAYESSVSAYRSKVDAERSRIEALSAQSRALIDGYTAGTRAVEATAGMYQGLYAVQVKDYEAGQAITLQAGKINSDNLNYTNSTRIDAAKAGAQVYAQLVSSAYSMIHASAGVSAGSQMGVNYSYSNDTTTAVAPVTSI